MVSIAISYNGKMPRYHVVSQAFYDRLIAWIAQHPRFDIVVAVVPSR